MGIIRLLFLSDTHLGFDLPFRPRIKRRRRGHDFFANYQRALEPALNGEVDCVIHGGDLLYRSKVPERLVALAAEPLKRVADSGVPVYLVPGNHERSIIPHFERMHHPNIFVFDRPRTYDLWADGIHLALVGFPFYRGNVRNAFTDLLAAAQWQCQDADASMLCIHQSVDGATVGPQDYMFGNKPDVLDSTAIPHGFAAVLSGHIHRHQVLTRDQKGRPLTAPIFYPGSIERTSFAEKDEEKGYLTLKLAGSKAGGYRLKHWKFVPLPARPMFRLDQGLNQIDADTLSACLADKIAMLPQDAILQLRFYGTPGREAAKRIRAAALREIAPESMNIEAVHIGQRRSGKRWPVRHPKSESINHPAPERPSWQKPLFENRPKRKTEP